MPGVNDLFGEIRLVEVPVVNLCDVVSRCPGCFKEAAIHSVKRIFQHLGSDGFTLF